MRILLVDDSATVLAAERSVLSRSGYQVITARTADEGQRLAVAEQPDLVLMDADLPQVGGPEACRRLAADPRTAAIPVLLLQAGWLEPPPGEPAWRAVVAKPLVEPELLRAVRGVVAAA